MISSFKKRLRLETKVQYLKGVGPKMAKKLERLEIITINDLLYHFPFRYQDYSLLTPINLVQEGEIITVKGKIKEIKNEYTRGGRKLQKAIIKDQTGELKVVWFNQPFLVKNIPVGSRLFLSGKVKLFSNQKHLLSPDYELITPDLNPRYKTIHTGRLVPVYPETKLISSKYLRKLVAQALPQVLPEIKEFLPYKILAENNLLAEKEAVEKIHFPENKTAAKKAKERLSFDEMFLIQLTMLAKKRAWQKGKKAPKIKIEKNKINLFKKSLPFKLTKSQKKTADEILADLSQSRPMNRLLQGDVGSGKTVVAAIAAYAAFLNRQQAAIMAPTEILAFQHFLSFKNFLGSFGAKIILITGSSKKSIKTANLDQYDIIIGTHTLIGKSVKLTRPGLIIIDEQHRFGVAQRTILLKKTGRQKLFPHLLTMTATPIPRTISLTLHGDLDISFLAEMPPGRKKTETFVVPPKKRDDCYAWIKKEIKSKKKQAFFICPLIEASESLITVKAAEEEFKRLKSKIFPKLKLGLLHGRIKTKEKKKVLAKMNQGKIDILVATPVVEVGIDIPQATIMLIEAADRFGLAQLHQLRGRVGRRDKKGYCFLLAENPSRKALKRLKTMEAISNGMKLAETDLRIRGPGEIYGLRQHGFLRLKAASLTDLGLIKKTRKVAEKILKKDPELKKHPQLLTLIKQKGQKPTALN